MVKPATLITGASRGIGAAIAAEMARQGHHVIGLSRTPPEGFPGTFVSVDLADAEATANALADVTRRFKVLRLVNNAGIAAVGPLEKISIADFDAVAAINIRAVMQGMQAVLPAMRLAHFGRIVNIGSRAGLGKEGRALYSASKAAVVGMTRTAALELARDGITVNCIAPGPIETDMIRLNYPAGSPSRDRLTAAVPVGRFGTPEEIASAAGYFLSDQSGFTTGQTLYVCGGASVGLSNI